MMNVHVLKWLWVVALLVGTKGCEEEILDENGQLDETSVPSGLCTFNFVNDPSKNGPVTYRLLFEAFTMDDCNSCYLDITKVDGSILKYCGQDIPNVVDLQEDTFSIEVSISGDCKFSMAWRQIPAEDSCCKELGLEATGDFLNLYNNHFNGLYKRQLITVNDHPLYYNEDPGDQGERKWLAFSNTLWTLSGNQYALPGSFLGVLSMDDSICPEHNQVVNTFDPLDPKTPIEIANPLTCETSCSGPPPEGPPEATDIIYDGDLTDTSASVAIGTLATYICANGIQKYAICDANGEWWHENLENCDPSGPNPQQEDPLPKPEDCEFVPGDLGAKITVGPDDCYYIKSHRKYSVAPYPDKKTKDEWIFEVDSACQLLRVQFEPEHYGIGGDPFRKCEDGDSLQIWDQKKKKASLISICGEDRPMPFRIFSKNRDKIFQWKTSGAAKNSDGFQAYITVKGC